MTAPAWTVRAVNTSVVSENKIHDDEVARSYGFAGGLVPGVDVYAYLTHVPAERWGIDWLARGSMSARLHKPVYDGDDVRVTASEAAPGGVTMSLATGNGECATATAALPPVPATPPDPGAWSARPLPAARSAASPASLAPGTRLGGYEFGFHADRAGEYLDAIGESLPLYRDERVAHPGWLLRSANYVLSANVSLGPWIHVSSAVTHHGLVHDGAALITRATVKDEFERKGHRFVVLDVVVLEDGARPVMTAEHTAIYEPRRTL